MIRLDGRTEGRLKSAMVLSGAYVYEHWRPDSGTCFYVGKGRGKRARDNSRNQYHANIVAKLKRLGLRPEARIIASGLSDADNGFKGKRHSAESRAKMSATKRARHAATEN